MALNLVHSLNEIKDFRDAKINTAAIDSAIMHLQFLDTGSKGISRLIEGQARTERKSKLYNIKTYFCYNTGNEDYNKEFNSESLLPYYAHIGNISEN